MNMSDSDDDSMEAIFMAAAATAVINLQSMNHNLGNLLFDEGLTVGSLDFGRGARDAAMNGRMWATKEIKRSKPGRPTNRAHDPTAVPLPGQCAWRVWKTLEGTTCFAKTAQKPRPAG